MDKFLFIIVHLLKQKRRFKRFATLEGLTVQFF